MSNKSRTLYIGMTGDLHRRVYEHKQKQAEGFTKKYNVTMLVYYESTNDVNVAIEREKFLKGKKRTHKVTLIESKNPGWKDLSEGWYSSSS